MRARIRVLCKVAESKRGHSNNVLARDENIVLSFLDNVRKGNIWIDSINQFGRWNLGVSDIAEKLSAMLRDYGNEFVDPLSVQEIVNAPQNFYVLYTRIGNIVEIVGMIAIKLSDGEVSSLCVASKYRNMGLGTRLVNYALTIIKKNSRTRSATVYVQKNNLNALRLFTNIGFVEVNELKTAKVLRKTL